MSEIHDMEERIRALAAQVAELLNEMDRVAGGLVGIGPGRISAPGAEIRRMGDQFTVR
jgi:hypothetical protein